MRADWEAIIENSRRNPWTIEERNVRTFRLSLLKNFESSKLRPHPIMHWNTLLANGYLNLPPLYVFLYLFTCENQTKQNLHFLLEKSHYHETYVNSAHTYGQVYHFCSQQTSLAFFAFSCVSSSRRVFHCKNVLRGFNFYTFLNSIKIKISWCYKFI